MEKLGKRIRERREAISHSLSRLGKLAGVSPSLLSQIEHGKAFPSLHTLKNIANSLNTTVGALIGENENMAQNPMVRFNERKLVKQTESGATLYLLSHYSPAQNIETFMVRLEKKGNCIGLTENSRHSQEFCHVLNGMVEVTLSGTPYLLNQGDSIYFHSKDLVGITNIHEGVSDFLWIVSPEKQR
jgi:XRE family transcriptional regulator, regulator of sulfur utilization